MNNFYGLIGEKLGHSYSPRIHDIILQKIGNTGSYNLFEIRKENLKNAVEGLKALEARGVNVTIPYKIEIIKYLNELSPEAEKIGAVNTVNFHNGTLSGFNTDYFGFGKALDKAKIDTGNKRALILGTGGVSKAVTEYLLDNGIGDVIYASRTPEKLSRSITEFKIIAYDDLYNIKNMDIIINCTPCGMYPSIEFSPVDIRVLCNFSTAVDLIYNPIETLFLKEAVSLGLKTANGLYMLVAQAVASQEIWHSIKIGEKIVDEIYQEIKSAI